MMLRTAGLTDNARAILKRCTQPDGTVKVGEALVFILNYPRGIVSQYLNTQGNPGLAQISHSVAHLQRGEIVGRDSLIDDARKISRSLENHYTGTQHLLCALINRSNDDIKDLLSQHHLEQRSVASYIKEQPLWDWRKLFPFSYFRRGNQPLKSRR